MWLTLLRAMNRLLAIAVILLFLCTETALARQKGPLFTPIIIFCPNAVSVTLDARALAAIGLGTFEIMQATSGGCSVSSRSTAEVQELALTPGAYTLRAPAGGGAGAVSLPFTVNAACDLTLP